MTPNIGKLLSDGKKHEVTQEDYDYFLGVLPPVCMAMTYQGEKWHFGFAEGAETIRLFKSQGDKHFAIETPYLNPYECGNIDSQKKRWVLRWLELGKKNPRIRDASDPPFDTGSFHECHTDHELLEKLGQGNFSLGQAFFIGNLCFINQIEGGDEWLAIKDGSAIDSISFSTIMQKHGMAAAQRMVDDIRAATLDQCTSRAYGRPR